MAGGKETPRQKLIGLMYLVLLAMLALQVSSAIMEKFKFLDDSLKFANEAADKNNDDVEHSIAKAVKDGGNRDEDKKVLEQAEKVRTEAVKIKTYIDKLRDDMIEKTDGYENPEDKTSMYKGAKEETKIEVMMVGATKNGEGYKLQEQINGFCSNLRKIMGKEHEKNFPNLALDAKDDPRISSKEQKKKDFAELNFAHTPMVAAMAVLSNLEAEVLRHETDALAILQTEVGASTIKFDKIEAAYTATSQVVAVGTKYEAELFMQASSSGIKPQMMLNGKPLKVEGGKGKIEFTATGGAYDKEGIVEKKWEGAIKIKNKGKDTTFKVVGKYKVAKPVIQIQSASVSALYRKCGNELNVQVPALGSLYNPDFKATGATAIKGSKKGFVTIVPTSPNVVLKVYSGGNFIGEQKFKVRLIPKPEIQALYKGKQVDQKRGVKKPGPSRITMKAVPDESFSQFLPKDARYNVSEWEAILVRGSRPIVTKKFNGPNGNFSSIRAKANAGDRIVIDVKKVKRKNFQGKIEDVKIPTTIMNIPIND